MTHFRSAVLLVSILMVSLAHAGTIGISQTFEDEPNGTLGSATLLNDNTGAFPCGFQWNLDDDFYEFTTSKDNSTLTVEAVGGFEVDTFIEVLNSSGTTIWYDDDGGTGLNARISGFNLPTAGTYYLWVYEATNKSGLYVTYTMNGQIVEPDIVDTTPPSYPGAAGIVSADRIEPTTVQTTWNQAIDDISMAAAIKYNIYWSTSESTVFAGAPGKVVTGVTSTTVTGISNSQTYYFGVRAEDEAGNEETNVVTAAAEPLAAANPAVWSLYE